MDPHVISLPRKVIVGNMVLERISEICEEFGFKRPLILADENTWEISGKRIKEELSHLSPVSQIVRDASLKEVERIRKGIKYHDVVIGTGGGVVIDVSKVLAWKLGSGFFSVPTAPSHDGIVSENASLKKDEKRISIKTKVPDAIIADIKILSEAPYRLIASGCADIISNITAVYDWKLGKEKGEYYSEYAAALSELAAEIVMKSADIIREKKERGIRNLMEALITSGIAMSIAQSSRPASGSEHMISHFLDSLGSHGLHGEQCGIASIGIAYLQGQEWKKIKEVLQKIGAPVSFREIGIEREKVIRAFLEAKNVRKRYTILNEKSLTRKMVEEILKETGIY